MEKKIDDLMPPFSNRGKDSGFVLVAEDHWKSSKPASKREQENLEFVLIDDLVIPELKKKKAVEEERRSFRCRICGSETYKEVTKSNGILGPGGWTKTLYCICDGCSVLFQNPKKFSK
jgi:hypothetical protein